MEKKEQIHYIPAKKVGSKRIVCDDDLTMLRLALTKSGIIVSNDDFKRYLNNSHEEYKQIIEERVLMYSFIDDTFMPAEDPLGKNGPSLDNFLRFETFANQNYMRKCPYRKKCTYGTKCKFWHPERVASQGNQYKTAHQSVLEEAQEQKIRLEIIVNNPDRAKDSFLLNNMITTSSSSASNMPNENRLKSAKITSVNISNANEIDYSMLQAQNSFKKNNITNITSSLLQSINDDAFNLPKKQLKAMGTNETVNPFTFSNQISSSSMHKQPSWPNNCGLEFESLSLNDAKKASFQAGKQSPPIAKSNANSELIDEKSVRSQLMDLVKSGDLTEENVEKVLREHPEEKDIVTLVFLASDASDL
jgi:hypothetical protein